MDEQAFRFNNRLTDDGGKFARLRAIQPFGLADYLSPIDLQRVDRDGKGNTKLSRSGLNGGDAEAFFFAALTRTKRGWRRSFATWRVLPVSLCQWLRQGTLDFTHTLFQVVKDCEKVTPG